VATQLNDMSLGGSGFAAGYTPIRFAPLVSLTGPIQGATPPTAAAPAAPMARPPILPQDQGGGGGYEGEGLPYYGGPLAGERSRGALQADLANAAGFFMNPLGMMANYVLTGQTPAMQFGIGNQREAFGLGPSDAMPQGIVPPGGVSRLFGGVRDLLFGPQQQSVDLGSMAPNSYQDAYSIGLRSGLSEEASRAAGAVAENLVAQGMDRASAVALASMTALGQVGPQMDELATQGVVPQTMAQSMMGGTGQAFGGYTQGGWDDPDRPVESGYSPSDFTGGGWSPGDVAGAYSDSTGFE
jgi:hypothetical protein